MNPNQELLTLRKQGVPPENVLEQGRQMLSNFPNDKYLKQAFAWCLYDVLKATNDEQSQRRTEHLKELQKLGLAGQDMAASTILNLVIKWAAYPHKLPFFRYWAQHFEWRSEDMQAGETNEGRKFDPLMIRFQRAVAKCWQERGIVQGDAMKWAEEQVTNWAHAEDVDIWVANTYAKDLLNQGKKNEARPYVCKVVGRKKREGWSWFLLAGLCEGDDEAELAVLKHAAALTSDAAFWSSSNTERLLTLLDRASEHSHASWVLQQYKAARHENGWKEPAWLQVLREAPWATHEMSKLQSSQTESEAMQVWAVLASEEVVEMIVDHQNQDKKLAWVKGGGHSCPLPYRIYPLATELAPGARIRAFVCDGKVVHYDLL